MNGLYVLFVCCLIANTMLFAQSDFRETLKKPCLFLPRDYVDFWVQDRLVRIDSNSNSGSFIITDLKAKQKLEAKFNGFREWSVVCVDGTYYGLKEDPKRDTEIAPAMVLKSSKDGKVWDEVGVYHEAYYPGISLPLDNGKFFVFHQGFFHEEDLFSRFAIYRLLESGDFVRDSIIDFGLEDGVIDKSTQRFKQKYQIFNSGALEMTMSMVSVTDNYYVFCQPSIGYFWVINRSNGKLQRLAKLYPEVDEVMKNGGAFETAVVCWQATEDGRVLLVSRSKDGVFKSKEEYWANFKLPHPTSKEFSDPEFMERMQKSFALAVEGGLAKYPILKWWELDPKTGKFTPHEGPDGKLNMAHDVKELLGYRFNHEVTKDGVVISFDRPSLKPILKNEKPPKNVKSKETKLKDNSKGKASLVQSVNNKQ